MKLAELLTWEKRYDEAERIYRELLAQNPYDVDIRISLAETMTWAGEADLSLIEYGHMIDEGNDDWRLLAGFLDAFLGAERRTDSDTRRLMWMVSLYDRAAEPPSLDIAGRLATALTIVGDFTSSLNMLETAVKENPDNRGLRMRLADALSSAGKHSEAQHHYRALLSEAREQGRSSSTRY
jgi:tetratricopeptide (TPR) repeat protein